MSLSDIRLPERPSTKKETTGKAQEKAQGRTRAKAEDADARRTAAIAAELFSDAGVSEPAAPSAGGRQTADGAGSSSSSRATRVGAHRRSMASLLFQAPDLASRSDAGPAVDTAADEMPGYGTGTAAQAEDGEESARPRRRRRSRSHAHRSDHRVSADDVREDSAVQGSDDAGAVEGEEDLSDASDDRQDEGAGTRSASHRRRRTRMNASERAAAAEVKFIEDDIARDAVRTEALAEDEEAADAENDAADDVEAEAGRTRSRVRRRVSARRDGETDEGHEGLRVRRRARRTRQGEEADDDRQSSRSSRRTAVSERTATAARPASGTRRQRERAYISKIKDVSGSTRLEAKRRRRRETRRDRTRQSFLLEQEAMARREHVDRQMIVRERGRHTQISVIEDDILVEHYVSDIDEVSTVGNIYVGRVQNVLPGMEAAFVNIGEARNGVLYAGEVNWDAARLEGKPQRIEQAYHSSDPIMVQVTKDPIGHKGARLTAQITLAGRYIVLVPSGAMTGVSRKLPERERTRLRRIVAKLTPKNMGVIIRTAADGASQEAIEKDFETLLTRWKNVQDRYAEFKDTHRPHILHREPDVAIRVVRDIFNDDFRRLVVEGDSVYRRIRDYLEEMSPDQLDKLEKWDPEEHHGADVFDEWKIDSQLRKGMERKVYLPSGGSLVIDRTEAMTTIDVNTGRFVGKGKSLEEIVTRVNLEAAEEIVRQLRLRDIGGMIMIDFVDMVMAENRDLVLRRLIECLSRDRTKHQVAEVTSLGLVQMTRKRVGQGLVEAFSQECPMCHGRGFILHDDPTIEINAADPYEAKGGDPFENSHDARREVHRREEHDAAAPKGSSAEVRRKLAQIAAAASREDAAQNPSHPSSDGGADVSAGAAVGQA